MTITIGFVKSDSQINVKCLNLKEQSLTQKVVDAIELKDINFQLLITNDEKALEDLEDSFTTEKRFYPIVSNSQISLNNDQFTRMDFEELVGLYNKVNARWILNNNIKTIEQVYSIITYLKDLWQNDRSSFFEELWFILKTNLATSELTIIFHDVDSTEATEKSKPQLINALISGEKVPNLGPTEESQDKLMQDYGDNFSEIFQITEFSPMKGELVATAHIDLSPILIMGKTSGLNQLQQSILIAIFTGLQSNK